MGESFPPRTSAAEPPNEFADQFATARPASDALELAEARRALRARMLDRRSAPPRLERYEIRRFLGAGGHGSVYEAFDPKLDRRVAIKVLRTAWEGEGDKGHEARLLREGRAIARISDPRVVAIHDVAQCSADFMATSQKGSAPAVFMVMEYVEGQTLRQWLEAEKRPLGAIVGIFVEAAQGLMAAHRGGVVHGDFKPENVMITADRRVKILDFGIARAAGGSAAGCFTGTPGYASPEQCRGETLDAKSDQYSFCRALEEAMRCARLPFGDARAARRVRQLDRVVRRGVTSTPAGRFESMQRLAFELEKSSTSPKPATSRAVSATLAALALLATVTAGGVAPKAASGECMGEAENPVFSSARSAHLEQAFISTKLPYAADSWRSVAAELESYMAKFRKSAAVACNPAGETHTATGAPINAVLRCLEERRRTLASLLDVMTERPREVVPHAVEAVFSLRPPASCLAVTSEKGVSSVTTMPPCAARIEGELYALDAGLTAATYEGAVTRSAAVRAAALTCAPRELGPWAGVVHGLHLLGASQPEPASTTLRAAYLEAEAAGNARMAMRAMTAQIVAYEARGEKVLVERLIEEGMARVDAGALEFGPDLQASFFEEVSRAWRHQARYADAFDLARRAVELREKHWGERHPLTLRAKKRLADVHYKQRDFRSAESLGIAVLADLVTYVGPHHPDAAGIDTLLGNIAWRRGSYDVANAHFENAQRVWTQLFGAEDPRAVRMVEARAAVHVSAGQFADAWEMLEPLLARTSSPREPPGGRAKLASGASEALIGMGRYEEAAELLRMALTTLVREKGESHAELGYALLGMGGLELARGNAARAEEHCQRAVALWKEQLGERHPKLSWAYACLGRAELESGREKAAAETLNLALSLYDSDVDDPRNLAEIEFALARSLERDNPGRARSLAAESAELFLKMPTHRQHAGRVLAWQHKLATTDGRRIEP